jgi:hypothetical protein
MAGGLLMAHPPVDPTPPSRPSRPGRLPSDASAAALAIAASVAPAERRQSPRTSGGTGCRSARRLGCSDVPGIASTPSRRRSAAAATSHGRLGVRRPITASMPADRREQAIAALAHQLIVHLERQLRQPDAHAQGRGRVAGSSIEQENRRESCHLPAHLHRRGAPTVLT